MNSIIEVLLCYSPKDEALMRELEQQLIVLEQQGLITIWHERMVWAGGDWQQELNKHLNSARIILLLVSADFLASEQSSQQIQRAMERYRAGEAQVIPVLLRPVIWKNTAFGQLKPLPKDGKAITSSAWHTHDEAFIDVVEGVQQRVEELNKPAASEQSISSVIFSELQGEQPMEQKLTTSVFLCYNSTDRPEVKKIGQELKRAGINPWLDEWELRPGLPWQRALEAEITRIDSAAVFVGKDGIGPWQNMELEVFLSEFARRGCPVIPVLLADAPHKPRLPLFLKNMTWVDFRKQEPDPMKQLIWGIMNKKPDVDNNNNNNLPQSPTVPPSSVPIESMLSFPKKAELVTILLACSCIRNRDSRETVLGALNDQIPGLANAVSRRTDNQADVMEIVSTCSARPGAMQELVSIVAYFEGESSIHTQRLKAFVQNNKL